MAETKFADSRKKHFPHFFLPFPPFLSSLTDVDSLNCPFRSLSRETFSLQGQQSISQMRSFYDSSSPSPDRPPNCPPPPCERVHATPTYLFPGRKEKVEGPLQNPFFLLILAYSPRPLLCPMLPALCLLAAAQSKNFIHTTETFTKRIFCKVKIPTAKTPTARISP